MARNPEGNVMLLRVGIWRHRATARWARRVGLWGSGLLMVGK